MAETIKELTPPTSKTELAKKLGVSRSTLYYRPKLPNKDWTLKIAIEKIMSEHKAYGHRRIAIALGINKKRTKRVMKLFGLKVLRRRKNPQKPKDCGQAPMAIPNLVSGLVIEAQHQVWVSDFTYLPYFGKFVYLATIEDVFTRQVVGWAVSTRHDANLVGQALVDASMLNSLPGIIHSDQGSEYRSDYYLNLVKSFGIKPSMSKKGSPWENGYQESFYSGFKLELGHPEAYADLGELIEAIAGQIHYYNNRRIHSALKCPPSVFAQRLNCQNNQLINRVSAVRQSV